MSLRLIELTLTDSVADRLPDALEGVDVLEHWREPTLENRVLVRILVRTEKSEAGRGTRPAPAARSCC